MQLLTDIQRDYLSCIHSQWERSALTFCRKKLKVSSEFLRRDEFEEHWQAAMVEIAYLIQRGEWDIVKEAERGNGRICWIALQTFYRSRYEHRYMERVLADSNEALISLVESEEPVVGGIKASRVVNELKMLISGLPEKRRLVMEMLVEVVEDARFDLDDMMHCVKLRIREGLSERGYEFTPIQVQNALFSGRKQLWEQLRERGLVSGERPRLGRGGVGSK